MEKIISVVKLMAKTGLFFAHVDGQYQRSEKRYIDNFLSGLNQIGDLDPDLHQEVLDSLKRTYTFEEIVDDTKALVDGFTDKERGAILYSMKGFINQVIRADNRVDTAETEAYKQWKAAFGLS